MVGPGNRHATSCVPGAGRDYVQALTSQYIDLVYYAAARYPEGQRRQAGPTAAQRRPAKEICRGDRFFVKDGRFSLLANGSEHFVLHSSGHKDIHRPR